MDELENLEKTVLKLGAALDQDQAFNRQVTQAAIKLYIAARKAILKIDLAGPDEDRSNYIAYTLLRDAISGFDALKTEATK